MVSYYVCNLEVLSYHAVAAMHAHPANPLGFYDPSCRFVEILQLDETWSREREDVSRENLF